MTDQPKRRFQFRLRTLMIGVTVFAVGCGYVGWQAKIVKDRNALRIRLTALGGASFSVSEYRVFIRSGLKDALSEDKLPTTSWLRSWLGDEGVVVAFIPEPQIP